MQVKATLLGLLIAFILGTTVVSAQGGIFGGGDVGGSIFDGIRRGISDIFENLGVGVPGGAIIPGITPAPAVVPPLPGEDLPPAANSVKQIKLSLEWDALSMGGEAVEPVFYDPLLGQDNLFGITDPHVNPDPSLWDLRSDFLLCPQCGSGTGFTPTMTGEDSQVLSAQPPKEPPRSKPPPPGGTVVSPWEICPEQTECLIEDVERVLTGWCGQDPDQLNPDRIPDITLGSQPGPNMFALPNAVSNKYVRRDGYAYNCVKDCTDGSCITENNYVEFQTAIYPSNAISLYLRIENPTIREIENILVRVTTLSYSPEGEYALPHNVDFPIENAVASPIKAVSLFQNNDFSYSHASTLGAKVDRGLNTMRTINTDAGSIPYSIQRNTARVTEDPEILFGPFDLPPTEKPGAIIELPLQPILTEFTRIPDTLSSYDNEEGVTWINPAKPCECQGVRLHEGRKDFPDCNTMISDPTDDQCRLYYGIGIKDDKGNLLGDHAGGFICNQGGITVEGCPPPWCFARLPEEGGYAGPKEVCPDGIISLPEDPYWYFNVDLPQLNYQEKQPGWGESLVDVLEEFLPSEVISLYRPNKTYAFGCTQPCQNDPPPGLSGVGGIIPRDYNFICDPDDPIEWGEVSRCEGTDPEVLVKPDDPRFQIYRDVTGIGGCGYYASSDNSVIGPIQVVAEYGADEDDNRTSRSVIVGSIPVGGRILDDQARPYGWPTTGTIEELWGPTSLAESNPGRTVKDLDYGEYRYCAEGQN